MPYPSAKNRDTASQGANNSGRYYDMSRGGITGKPGRWQVYFGGRGDGVRKRFTDYDDALTFLSHLRVEQYDGTFDKRDYDPNKPLAFDKLCDEFVEYKKVKGLRSWQKYSQRLRRAACYFRDRNIKTIDFPELDDMLIKFKKWGVPPATQKLCLETVRFLFNWLRKRKILKPDQVPQEWPKVEDYEMGWRKIINIETQGFILTEIQKMAPFRAWLAIRWLSTYVSIRPTELVQVKEGDFDLELGVMYVTHTKTGKRITVPLLPEDVATVQSLPRGFPELYFFRHDKGNGAAEPGTRFGKDYLYNVWKRATNNLGVVGVDLYGGTRHSTVVALRKSRTPEEIKRGTQHSTNKAFERYYQVQLDELRSIYADTRNTGEIKRIKSV